MKKDDESKKAQERRRLNRNKWTIWRGPDRSDELNSEKMNQLDDMLMTTKEMKMRQEKWRKEKAESKNDESSLQDPDKGDKPGWSNALPYPRISSEKLGGGEERGGGAYKEIFTESIALHKAGRLADTEGDELVMRDGHQLREGVGLMKGQEIVKDESLCLALQEPMEKLEQHGGGDGLVRREENISGESELVGLLKGQDLLKD